MVKVYTPIKEVDISPEIKQLIIARNAAKVSKDYALADQIRTQVESLGYQLNDDSSGNTQVLRLGDGYKKLSNHYLILFGSGETAPTSVDIYRSTFLALGKRDLTIGLITTPAGFQPNVMKVYGDIKDFLLAALPDFNLTINIIPINNSLDANNDDYLSQIKLCDVIFLGPGSPTYAVRHLKNTKALQTIIDQVKECSTLILASAATISFSKYALPVYEIYKVGEDLHWKDGLDLYQEIYKSLSVIPHFNNREGGVDLDTSYCYIGKDRATKLLSMLSDPGDIIGIDEHTALVIDLKNAKQFIKGKGSVVSINNN